MYTEIKKNIYDCQVCPTRCDGKSKLNYQFIDDVKFAEEQEEIVRNKINNHKEYKAVKCDKDGYPDVEILHNNKIYKYLEVKAQRRTFMSVERFLPSSNLKPSETLALNLSDLERYFRIEKDIGIQTSLVWVLMNRPCIVKENEKHFYYQTTENLKKIYNFYQNKRRFRRKSGLGDIVDGVHKGVTVNYHFSINELLKWGI
jgi:hypothetical protein